MKESYHFKYRKVVNAAYNDEIMGRRLNGTLSLVAKMKGEIVAFGKMFYDAKGFKTIKEYDDNFDGHILKTGRMLFNIATIERFSESIDSCPVLKFPAIL